MEETFSKKDGISVVVAVLNGNETLQKCLDSVLAQRNAEFEILVIDGGSVDGSVETILNNAERIYYWVSEADSGIYSAWNKAIRLSRYKWIYFLGCDDEIYDPYVFERVLSRAAHASKESLLIYADILIVSKRKNLLIRRPLNKVLGVLKSEMVIPHQGTFHRADLFDRIGLFDESFIVAADYLMVLRSLNIAPPEYIGPLVVAKMGFGGLSNRAESRLLVLREFRKAQRICNITITMRWIFILFLSFLRLKCRSLRIFRNRISRHSD